MPASCLSSWTLTIRLLISSPLALECAFTFLSHTRSCPRCSFERIMMSIPFEWDWWHLCLCMWALSCSVQLFVTPWTITRQAPLSMEFSRQEYWSALPFPTPRDLPNSGIKPLSPGTPALAGRFFTTEPPGKSSPVCYVNFLDISWGVWRSLCLKAAQDKPCK